MATWKRLLGLGLPTMVVNILEQAGIKTDVALRKWISNPERKHIKGIGERAEAQIRQALALEVMEVGEIEAQLAELESLGVTPEEAVELGVIPPLVSETEVEEVLEATPEEVEAAETPEPEGPPGPPEPPEEIPPEEPEPQPEPEAERPEEPEEKEEVTPVVPPSEAPASPTTPPHEPTPQPEPAPRPAREEVHEREPSWLSRNWGWLPWAAAMAAMLIAAGLLFGWPGWAWNWRAPRIQPYEVVKEVPVEREVVRTVEVEKVVEKIVTATPGPVTATPIPTQPPTAMPTVMPVPTVTPDQRIDALVKDVKNLAAAVSGLSEIVSQTMASQVHAAPVLTSCQGHGTIAWQNDNLLQPGALYGEAPIGGLSESRWIVAQCWTDQLATERWVFAIRPGTVAWLSGHRGGTGWFFCGTGAEVLANLQQQVGELETRDGKMTTHVVILPDEKDKFRLVTRVQTGPTPGPTVTSTTTATPTVGPSPTPTRMAVPGAGNCQIPGESVGPAILEGEVGGKPTVIKLSAGQKYSLVSGSCWTFPSQTALDARWPDHKSEFLKKYSNGQTIEK